MPFRLVLYGLVAIFVVGGFAVAADAVVVSDEERLEQLADELTEAPPHERIGGVLRWMDLSREPVRIARGSRIRHFAEEDAHRLHDDVFEALEPFATGDLDVVQRTVRVDGERGIVAARVRVDGAVHDTTLSLVRSGQGWLVTSVQVP